MIAPRDSATTRAMAAEPPQFVHRREQLRDDRPPGQGIRLFVGGHASRVQGEMQDLAGDRCFSAAHRPQRCGIDPSRTTGLLDSGAFTDPPEKRLTPEGALLRQLAFEERASEKWGEPWSCAYLVSYDLLIDETWISGQRHKRRWSVFDAEGAVETTVAAARYLASARELVAPRKLVLSLQGVDDQQYQECCQEVLSFAHPSDIIGLGGWCILGRQKSLMPIFWRTLHRVLPMVARAGIERVHIFGVLYLPALGGLLWLADEYGLAVSTDSTAPILNCTWANKKKSGARRPYWRDNVRWWQRELADLRSSPFYKEPPALLHHRQLSLF